MTDPLPNPCLSRSDHQKDQWKPIKPRKLPLIHEELTVKYIHKGELNDKNTEGEDIIKEKERITKPKLFRCTRGKTILDRAFAHYRIRNPTYQFRPIPPTFASSTVTSTCGTQGTFGTSSSSTAPTPPTPSTFQSIPSKFSVFESPRDEVALGTPKSPLSKFLWDRRYVPLLYLEKIVLQLKESNEFVLDYHEWLIGDSNDIQTYAGYYEEIPRQLCRIKLTNGDRRKLLSMYHRT